MDFVSLITDNALILVPALYVLGMIFKGTEKIQDKYIPLILLPIGIAGAIALIGFSVQGFVQGILVVGAAVYANQLVKQFKKDE
ncbi:MULTISPECIES: phage holin family protein [Clostridium]|uniref:Phage holin family Hol44, holin superfamily V n=1 Tax=Clostridium intestinale DSM 6191 TaxID=1121320 RepID=A0A1M5TJK9_9CLOT|nr:MULTISPECIES: phage holin family protein [Clostridium]SHH50840.1 Phage holin family Hol44, holin superfamily V [Clostridium intestinale DSM 6191]